MENTLLASFTKNYKCPVCGKELKSRNGLIYHLINHYKKKEISKLKLLQLLEKTKHLRGKKPKYV